ncbi:MAG: PilZ domain-containing protein [Candidatus Acidiferrales bacterium]
MGRRSEQRMAISFPVTVRGSDSRGNQFSVATKTFDISLSGASLCGLNTIAELGGKIEIESGDQHAWCKVQWVGKSGSSKAGRIGVRCLEPGKYIWGVPAKGSEPDTYDPSKPEPLPRRPSESAGAYAAPPSFGGDERRKFARHACRIETQVGTEDGSIGVPGTITDVSLGGCYVEMLSPLPVDSTIHLSLNPGTATLHMSGKVRSSQVGLGMGVSFTGMGPEDFEKLWRFAPPTADPLAHAKAPPMRPTPLRESALPRNDVAGATARSYATAESGSFDLSPTAEALDAVVRLLLSKGVFTQGELAEVIEKAKIVK